MYQKVSFKKRKFQIKNQKLSFKGRKFPQKVSNKKSFKQQNFQISNHKFQIVSWSPKNTSHLCEIQRPNELHVQITSLK